MYCIVLKYILYLFHILIMKNEYTQLIIACIMKKTITISIADQAFNIDEDAYMKLKEYLESIETYFKSETERKEIIEDIELRVAEILGDKKKSGKSVITSSDIDSVIEIIGNPSDFHTGETSEETNQGQTRASRRMYRDPDNRIIGGVCGGIGTYFDFDPLILRIVFVIALLVFGTGLLIYILLWIVIPEAKTIEQKYEMRGKPMNFSDIGKNINDEFRTMSNKFILLF